MADYLTRLVERTLGLSPAVRPEIPPTFAPETGNPPAPEPAGEPAPDTYSPPPDVRPTRRTGDPSRRLEQTHHPEPEDDAPLVQQDGGNLSERDDVPPSTTGGPLGTKNAEERTVIEHHPTEVGGDVTLREPEGQRQSPPFAPPGAAVAGGVRREGSGTVVSDRRGVPTSEPLTGPSGTSRDDDNGPDEQPTGPSETSARPAKRPGGRELPTPGDRPATARGETDVSTSLLRYEAEPSVARAHTAAPTEAVDPNGPRSPVRESLATHDRPVSSGREEHDRTSDPAARRPGPVAAPHQRYEAAKETPSPTVRITIGRVEVRAIPPEPVAAQPPTEARSEPALSLEDYLRQHSGRRQ